MEISDEENPRVRFTVEYRPRRSVAKQNVFTPAELDLMPALTFAEYKSSGAKHAWPKHKHSVLMLDGLADKQKAADIDAISIHSESLEEQHVAMQNAIAQQQECAGTTDGKNDTDDMCAVCIDGFDAESAVRALVCGHVFHCECIDRWLLSKSSRCPLCNSDTRTSLGLPQRPPKAKTADTLRQA
ncbi:hypothetical protein EC988_002965 [Linderina pennispora]|nr:hypothetical protein EC988_002965 [Linderina pennispora]